MIDSRDIHVQHLKLSKIVFALYIFLRRGPKSGIQDPVFRITATSGRVARFCGTEGPKRFHSEVIVVADIIHAINDDDDDDDDDDDEIEKRKKGHQCQNIMVGQGWEAISQCLCQRCQMAIGHLASLKYAVFEYVQSNSIGLYMIIDIRQYCLFFLYLLQKEY